MFCILTTVNLLLPDPVYYVCKCIVRYFLNPLWGTNRWVRFDSSVSAKTRIGVTMRNSCGNRCSHLTVPTHSFCTTTFLRQVNSSYFMDKKTEAQRG